MVVSTLAAGAAAVGLPSSVYSYNREAWMNDVQMRQNTRIQKQELLVSKVDMWREDIRDLISSVLIRQGNFVVISTLMLAIAAEAYIEGPLPENSPEFLFTAYRMCVGSALLYMILSTFCALAGNHLAAQTYSVMLTSWVRLPVEELVAELDDSLARDTVEAFEHQPVSTILRMPGASRVTGEGITADFGLDDYMRALEDDQRKHMTYYHRMEKDWDELGSYAFMFGALGVHNLLQTLAYYSAAMYYSGDEWSSWIVHFVITLSDAFVLKATDSYLQGVPCGSVLSTVSALGTQLTAGMAIRLDGVADQICVTLCFVLHLSLCVLGFVKLHTVQLQQDGDDVQSGSSVRMLTPNKGRHYKGKRIVTFSVGIVFIAWVICLAWVCYHVWNGTIDDGLPPSQEPEQARRRLLAGDWDQEASGAAGCAALGAEASLSPGGRAVAAPVGENASYKELLVAWPSRHFRPHSLSCGPGGRCFVASKFRIFELTPAAQGGFDSAEVLCPSVDTIFLDASAACDSTLRCRVHVLTRDSSARYRTVDCGSGEARALLRGVSEKVALMGSGSGLLALSNGRVIQYGQPSAAAPGEWEPLWPVAHLRGGDVASLAARGESSFALFDRTGRVELVDLASGEACAPWSALQESLGGAQVLAGSLLDSGDVARVLLLDQRGEVRYLQVPLPGLSGGCAAEAAEGASGSAADL